MAPIVPFSQLQSITPLSENSTPPKLKLDEKGAGLQLQRMRDSPLDGSIIQVLNQAGGVVHLFAHRCNWKNPTTLCGRWACGSLKRPSSGAEFATTEEWTGLNSFHAFCDSCYGDVYPADRCLPTPARLKKGHDVSSDSSSS